MIKHEKNTNLKQLSTHGTSENCLKRSNISCWNVTFSMFVSYIKTNQILWLEIRHISGIQCATILIGGTGVPEIQQVGLKNIVACKNIFNKQRLGACEPVHSRLQSFTKSKSIICAPAFCAGAP